MKGKFLVSIFSRPAHKKIFDHREHRGHRGNVGLVPTLQRCVLIFLDSVSSCIIMDAAAGR